MTSGPPRSTSSHSRGRDLALTDPHARPHSQAASSLPSPNEGLPRDAIAAKSAPSPPHCRRSIQAVNYVAFEIQIHVSVFPNPVSPSPSPVSVSPIPVSATLIHLFAILIHVSVSPVRVSACVTRVFVFRVSKSQCKVRRLVSPHRGTRVLCMDSHPLPIAMYARAGRGDVVAARRPPGVSQPSRCRCRRRAARREVPPLRRPQAQA